MPILYKNIKINYDKTEELIKKINILSALEIIKISDCTPEYTDTKKWKNVYYTIMV